MRLIGIATVCLVLAVPQAFAIPYPDDDDQRHVPAFVTDVFLSRDAAERAARTDLQFSQNMMRHHQGAIDMAKLYLSDPRGKNPILLRLANGIIKNQEFEIEVLNIVKKHVSEGPRQVGGAYVLRRGREGHEHDVYFIKAAPPGALDLLMSHSMTVSEFDLQFARPMIEHHSMALDMAMKYNRDPDGRSSIIGPMNYEMMIDQRTEIDLLRRVMARYPGDVASVPDDSRMTEIMHRSMPSMAASGGQHEGKALPATKSSRSSSWTGVPWKRPASGITHGRYG